MTKAQRVLLRAGLVGVGVGLEEQQDQQDDVDQQ
jgi:hypothetical protein